MLQADASFIRLTHTGISRGRLYLSDLDDEENKNPNDQVIVYVPFEGTVDVLLTDRVLTSYQQGSIRGFADAGLLTAQVFVDPSGGGPVGDIDLGGNDLLNVGQINGLSFDPLVSQFQDHLSNTSNPHEVTAAQAGAVALSAVGAASGVASLDGTGTLTQTEADGVSLGGDLGGTISSATVTDLTITGESQGSILYFDGTNWVQLPPGEVGYSLRTQGAGADPTWQANQFENTWTVSETGDAAEFSSIALAVAEANAIASITKPQSVLVYPGTYQEPPMTVSDFVTVLSQGRVVVEATDDNSPLFTMVGTSRLENIRMTGPANAATVCSTTPGSFPVITDFVISSANVAFDASGAGVVLAARDGQILSSVSTGLQATNGARLSIQGILNSAPVGASIVGSGSELSISSSRFLGNTVSYFVDDGGTLIGQALKIENTALGIRTGTNNPTVTKVEIEGLQFFGNNVLNVQQQAAGTRIFIASGLFQSTKVEAADWNSLSFTYNDEDLGEEALDILGELHVGLPERPSESSFGEGDSYTEGMIVLTSDNTASATTEGGNITDVSTAARSITGSTFSFQGNTAGHTIMVGSEREYLGQTVKHWGFKFDTETAAVLGGGSFVFEIWDGANWVEVRSMSVSDVEAYRYADNPFIRANSSEHTRLGIREDTTWARKVIDGHNLYWTRIRIESTVTTAPTFQRFKLHPAKFEVGENGFQFYFGPSRIRRTLLSSGNVFGESGGVASYTISVGSGGVPTGWNHNFKNSELNTSGDAIYAQLAVPRGVDTSLPLNLDVTYIPTTSAAGPATLVASCLPVSVEGVLIADPAGGKVPINRPLADTDPLGSAPAQVLIQNVDVTDATRFQTALFAGFDISHLYEGDIILLRIELDNDGGGANIGISMIEVSVANWTPGDRT